MFVNFFATRLNYCSGVCVGAGTENDGVNVKDADDPLMPRPEVRPAIPCVENVKAAVLPSIVFETVTFMSLI